MQSIENQLVLSAVYAVAIYIPIAYSAVLVSRNKFVEARLQPAGERFGGIDGLRGLLAIAVFIHHTVAARMYLTNGKWGWSESPLFNHLGQTGVALFFMITGFLFSMRLLRGGVIWRSIFISRVARLVPLYVLFVVGVAASVFYFSDWEVHEPLPRVAEELGHWIVFSIFERPDINALPMTWTLSAGVNWSLRYEWFFYAFMPVLYLLLLRLRVPRMSKLFATGLVGCLVVLAIIGKPVGGWKLYVLHFASGTAIALLRHQTGRVRGMLGTALMNLAGGIALVTLLVFKDAEGGAQILLTATFLASVVARDRGLLHQPCIRWLGEISYGFYLLHGLVLFMSLSLIRPWLHDISVPIYTIFAAIVGVTVMLLATLTYFTVELPGIRLGKWANIYLEKTLGRASWRINEA